MAENNERRAKMANDIMADACLPTQFVDNGVHVAIRDAIIEALEREYVEGWNAAMGGTTTQSSGVVIATSDFNG